MPSLGDDRRKKRKKEMIICPKCKEIIGPTAPVYKASRGFVDIDGTFHDDESVVVHMECHSDYTYNPFEHIEEIIKEG